MGDPKSVLCLHWEEYEIDLSHIRYYGDIRIVQESVKHGRRSLGHASRLFLGATELTPLAEVGLPERSRRLSVVAVLCATACSLSSSSGHAGPLGVGISDGSSGTLLVQKAHGFHCRPMYGWIPVSAFITFIATKASAAIISDA